MSAPNRYGIKECGNATFYDLTTGKAVMYLDTLKTSGIEVTSTSVYATGGRGNTRILSWSTGKEVKATFQDCVFSNTGLAVAAGGTITTGASSVYKRDVLTVASNKITLTKAPVGDPISVYKLLNDGTHGTEYVKAASLAAGKYTINAKDITFNTGELTDGTKVVVYYKMTTDNTATKIVINADTFGGNYKVVMDVLVRDVYDKKDYAGQLIIPCCKAQDNFSLSFSSDGDPSVFDIPLDILKDPSSSEMFELNIYDESLAV